MHTGARSLHTTRLVGPERGQVEIIIKFWGNIGYFVPQARGKFSLRKSFNGTKTVQMLVKELGLPKDLNFVIAVNNRVVEDEYVLEDRDEVALFTPGSGG